MDDPRDKLYKDGYHWGIKGKALRQDQTMLDQEWYVGYEDGKGDYERIRDEGTLEEQLEASLKWFAGHIPYPRRNDQYHNGVMDSQPEGEV